MKEHKKYTDIIRLGHKSTQGVLNVGDRITITEKIDGANAHFGRDEESHDGLIVGSRNQKLSDASTLSGFYFWVIENIYPRDLINGFRYYGEWAIPHKIKYRQDVYKNFYLFSIYDETTGQYIDDAIVQSEAIRLGLKTPEYFYEGEYISFEHLQGFVGKSNTTEIPNTGEGIVVKNVDYRDRFGNQIFVKLVSEAFAEIQSQKLPKDPSRFDEIDSLVRSVLTENRVEKILLKKVAMGELHEDFAIEDMGMILKLITSEVFNDCMKEESDVFENKEMELVRKSFGKTTPFIVKEVLKKR